MQVRDLVKILESLDQDADVRLYTSRRTRRTQLVVAGQNDWPAEMDAHSVDLKYVRAVMEDSLWHLIDASNVETVKLSVERELDIREMSRLYDD